jgi:single-strand DNA-binding protein
MAGTNINRIVLSGNLTRDPELKELQTGGSVCKLRLANNTRRKVGGEWGEHANYFDVTVWGSQGENCARFLSKGSPIMVDGRMEWREWTTPEGAKRQSYDVIADNVQFLGGRDGGSRSDGGGGSSYGVPSSAPEQAPAPAPAPASSASGSRYGSDDDIPF